MGTDFYESSIRPFAAIIIKICRAYTHKQQDFDDYYQEVCLQIWRSRDQFKHQCEWSTWIYKISLNVCLTYLKKAKNKQYEFVSDPQAEAEHSDEPSDEHDSITYLYWAIRRLSETDRALILLYLEELPQKIIAEIIGSTPNNVGVRVKRIKQRLNKIMNQEEV